MQSYDSYLTDFFKKNSETLKQSYPGIKISFLREICRDDVLEWGKSLDNQVLDVEQKNLLDKFFDHLLIGAPIEHFTQKGHFFGRDFYLNSDVLIPRFETEVLVDKAISFCREINKDHLTIAEVGFGSGCIGVSLLCELAEKEINLSASDICVKALKVGKVNVQKFQFQYNKKSKVNLIVSDRMNNFDGMFDLIVSNPPYIQKRSDISEVHFQTEKHEPHVALFLPDIEYDDWFKTFFSQVERSLSETGAFFMEGHENHLKRLLKISTNDFDFRGELITDLTGRDRVLYLTK
ncbi:MAG: hypothetical protein CME61_01950 [Halobacteriovoraceae bacterium]|nr:hypothetical protein [Halobacteriovoraceae bacterium]